MANFKGHVTTAAGLGLAYGSLAFWRWHLPLGPVVLASGLTTVGGLLPDLDSDKSVPNRMLFRLLAAAAVILGLHRLWHSPLPLVQGIGVLAGTYLLVNYVLAHIFRRLTVHRGMFHSIPAMLIAALAVYLGYVHFDEKLRLFWACGVALGFLSHLLLDEICAVDLRGARVKKAFGSAMKLYSTSWLATGLTYSLLFLLTYFAFR